MRLLVSVLALVLATPTFAYDGPCIEERPPARYNYEPTQPYTVKELKPSSLRAMCRFHNTYRTLFGCADTESNIIYMANNLSSGWYNCVLSHEKAHLNGWPGDHPR